MEENQGNFLPKLRPLIRNWEGQYPDLRKMFSRKEIEWLLAKCAKSRTVLSFVISCGYKDEPDVDQDGKPLLRRTTALHLARDDAWWLSNWDIIARDFFRIYDKFDVNYIDNEGFTHFHLACDLGLKEIVEKFLEFGQDPNCLGQSGDIDPPLHVALDSSRKEVVELLLDRGADPSLTTTEGFTPLHVICKRPLNGDGDDDMAELFFKIIDEKYQTVQIDARDQWGNTPLILAVDCKHRNSTEVLLRRGADPNIANVEGSTPLHIICMSENDEYEFMQLFFNINKEMKQPLQVDARDKEGRTPLQWAVANLMPKTFDVLLDNGANLASFVFPTESHFNAGFKYLFCESEQNFKLRLTSGARAVVEHLQKRGYELDRSDALTIMAYFAKHGFFDKSANLNECWFDDEEFATCAKELMMNSSLSLHDLVQLRSKEAEKRLTYADYLEFANSYEFSRVPERCRQACAANLCEKLQRIYFRRWALDFFLELTRQRLPILCCEMIIEELPNEDLYNICLAIAGRSSAQSIEQLK
uniref:Uncharacterized protein n=1 Tax=Trichogramma kaykai TaxID=54128 RepID=A0ABD2X279_9HYME